jgi:hypothetical protein
MPRNPANRRMELLLSPEQYEALLKEAESEGLDTSGSVAEFLRDHLAWTLPAFGKAAPLKARGKYQRKK